MIIPVTYKRHSTYFENNNNEFSRLSEHEEIKKKSVIEFANVSKADLLFYNFVISKYDKKITF